MKKKFKLLLEAHTECPHCKKKIVFKRYEDILKPSVKAEKKVWVEVEKDLQSKLTTGGKQK